MDGNANNVEKMFDFNQLLTKKAIGYSCRVSEFDECEKDCRRVMSQEFKRPDLVLVQNRAQPNYNVLVDRANAEYACTKYTGQRAIQKPGLDVFAKIETDPTRFGSLGKYVPLGRLCCRNPCRCEMYLQNAYVVSPHVLDKSSLFQNLTTLVADRSRYVSYECENEISSCLLECRNALAEYLQSDLLMTNDTTKPLITSNVDVLSQATPGSRICEKLALNITTPGLNVYLRYTTNGENLVFPLAEEVHIGRLCCFPFRPNATVPYVYVPFNRCIGFDDGQLVIPKLYEYYNILYENFNHDHNDDERYD